MIAMVSIMMVAQIAKAGISTTKHNLSNSGPGSVKASSGEQNNEICVYCHTPHFAATAAGGPLWNKAVQTTTYTMYGTTLAGTAPDTAPNGITKACLSCHDGVNAINSIINQAGAGNVNPAGALVSFGGVSTAVVMTGSATNIGTSLANDHPVSIAYTETTKAGLKVKTTALSGWVGATTIQSLLRADKVECSSCHDPHSDTNTTFLRVANSGSALCLGCHNK